MPRIKLKKVELLYGFKCNLECNGCSSASNIIKTTVNDPSLHSIFSSIENLSKHVDPESIDLMGGELFLYWDRVEHIAMKIRQYYPDTKIVLATNGLLLNKFKQRLLDFCEKYHPCEVDITDHFTLFSKDIKTKKYHKNLEEFLSGLTRTAEIKWDDSLSYLQKHKTRNIDNWKNLLVKERTFQGKVTNYRVTNQHEFKTCYYVDADKIKPHATNDPHGSYANGCAMPCCYTLVDSKLYKCSWFVVLPLLLEKYQQTNDPDWQKYLKYMPVNLANPNYDQLLDFEKTSLTSISLCDMCNNKPVGIPHTVENVLSHRSK